MKLERSDANFPFWRKKVDSALRAQYIEAIKAYVTVAQQQHNFKRARIHTDFWWLNGEKDKNQDEKI